MEKIPQTPRTTLKRLPKRGSYDRETIEAILDAARRFQVGRLPLINHLKNLNLITSTESDDLEEALSRLTENSWSS